MALRTIIQPCSHARQRQCAHRIEGIVKDMSREGSSIARVHEHLKERIATLPEARELRALSLSMPKDMDHVRSLHVWHGESLMLTIMDSERLALVP